MGGRELVAGLPRLADLDERARSRPGGADAVDVADHHLRLEQAEGREVVARPPGQELDPELARPP